MAATDFLSKDILAEIRAMTKSKHHWSREVELLAGLL